MADVTVINLTEVQQYLKGLPEDALGVAKKEISKTLFEVDTKVKTQSDLNTRSGNLFKSLQVNVEGKTLKDLKASYFSDSVYANIHEHGGEIKAKNAYTGVPGGPFLNIPGKANKTASGVTRLQAREVFAQGGFIMGRTVMRGGSSATRRYDVMFFLKKKVQIPARLKMIETTEGEVPTLLSRIAAGIGEN